MMMGGNKTGSARRRSYPHARIAKVGGVSELELARLEISFCFLAVFELVTSIPLTFEL